MVARLRCPMDPIAANVPLTGCDCFHLALDAMMRRTGQGRNLGQAVVELDGRVDLARLRDAAARLAAAHPIVHARLRRGLAGAPAWSLRRAIGTVPVSLWREPDVASRDDRDGTVVETAQRAFEARLDEPLEPEVGRSLRLDVVDRGDGGSSVAVTFAHVLLDALGADSLLVELDRLSHAGGTSRAGGEGAGGERRDGDAPPSILPAERDRPGWRARLRRAAPSGRRLDELERTGFRSLADAQTLPGRARYRVLTLDRACAAVAFARAERTCGPVATMPFFLACALRAHARVFRARGVDPGGYVLSVPVQTRPKRAAGAIFQNHVSILFFHVTCAEASSTDAIVATVRSQLASAMRARLDLAFSAGLELARRIPSRLYVAAVRRRFHGEICSFFHSYTGPFAPALATFLDVPVRNAYHAPAVAAPPGTGLFVGERHGRLNVTLAWREPALGDGEATLLLDQAVAALCGDDRA